MSKQAGLAACDALQPVDGPRLVPAQGLELPIGPSRQKDVDVPQGRIESRRVEATIVVDPSADVRIEHPRQIVERLVAALVKRPASDRLSDRLERFVAGRGAERDADLSAPPPRQPRPERVAEEVELLVRIVSAPIIVLAVDDLRLLRMKRQSAIREPLLERGSALVSVDVLGTEAPPILVSGNDFYSTPRLSPDGGRLVWLTWNHPNMPWVATVLITSPEPICSSRTQIMRPRQRSIR